MNKMCKKIINWMGLFFASLSLSSCDIDDSKSSIIFYNDFGEKIYYKAELFSETPSLENERVYFPILSSKRINKISNCKIFNNEKEISSSIFESSTNRIETRINDNLFLTLVSLSFNINTFEDIDITKLSLNIDNNDISYNTEIGLNHYTNYSENSLIFTGFDILETNTEKCTFLMNFLNSSTTEAKFVNLECLNDGVSIDSVYICGDNNSSFTSISDLDFVEIKNDGSNSLAFNKGLLKVTIDFSALKNEAIFFKEAFKINASIKGDLCSAVSSNNEWTCFLELYKLIAEEVNEKL